ncbi:Tic22-like protein [Gracilaria domingensis]|nr:Tic22-like protein [Gracilaria domingensis]
MQSGSFQKAIRLYTKALELDPGNAILYSNRSAAHFNIRQFSESLEDAESSILCDSMWWKAYKRKGLALIHMQRYEEAIEALEEGLKIVGKNAEMEKNLEFARACQEQAQNLYILPEPHMMQRLESVPVFIVTDTAGQPFFVTYDDGQQVCTFYFDQEDAKATLDWIKSENPDLGDTARVIHITLYQAFNLAQETQKQYYEETTRAAAEEDRAAAAAAAEKSKHGKLSGKITAIAKLTDDTDKDKDEVEKEADDWEEGDADVDTEAADDSDNVGDTDEPSASEEPSTSEKPSASDEPSASEEPLNAGQGDGGVAKGEEGDSEDTAEGSTTPTEAADSDEKTEDAGAEEAKEKEESKKDDSDEKKEDDITIDDNAPLSFQFRPELRQVQVAVDLLNKHPNPPVRPILRDPPSVRKAKAEARAAEAAKKATEKAEEDSEKPAEAEESAHDEKGATVSTASDEATDKNVPKSGDKDTVLDEDDEELTVDNFNGIPVFQAKGLTLLQKNKQLIPLFFSKWDLEAAWKQLKDSNTIDVPGVCEIEVGTLEDVLRRMSESKTDEFESVFFVPSRESMKAINVRFPLDELAPPFRPGSLPKKQVRKAGFSKARQIAERGGTKDEIRAAIREDLEKHAERQRMAEIIAQIEQARRAGGVGAAANVSKKSAKTTKAKVPGVKA